MRVILLKQSSAITNVTHLVDKYHARGLEVDLTAASEIYVGSQFPFNNFFMHVTSENGNTGALSIEYWDGTQFRTAPNIVDETELDNATLAQSGYVSFNPDELYPWQCQDARYITDIQDQVFYGLYWARITFNATLTQDVLIKYLGHCFCTDNELYGEFYKFSTVDWLDAWGADKTDWLEQRITASNLIVNELKSLNKIKSESQILDRFDLKDACVQMVAYMIYLGSGSNYSEDSTQCFNEAIRRLRQTTKIDANNDGIYNKVDVYKPKTSGWSR